MSDTFPERLFKARLRSGKTQAEIADMLGLGRTSVTNMEAGKQAPSLKAAIVLARALNFSLDGFIQKTPNELRIERLDKKIQLLKEKAMELEAQKVKP